MKPPHFPPSCLERGIAVLIMAENDFFFVKIIRSKGVGNQPRLNSPNEISRLSCGQVVVHFPFLYFLFDQHYFKSMNWALKTYLFSSC